MKQVIILLLFTVSVGCDSSSSYSFPSSSSSSSDVMSESERQAIVDGMVGQGVDRTEADAFTRALNDAQREFESGN